MNVYRIAIMGAIIGLGTAASARDKHNASAEAQLRTMLKCNGIADPVARVTCYDQAATQPQTIAAAQTPKKPTPADPAPPAQMAAQSFGADTIEAAHRSKQDRPAQVTMISAQVVSRNEGGPGYWIYRLDSGMSWQTVETSELRLPATGDRVTIRRTMFGGYMMDVGRRAAVKVVRLQ